MCKAQFSFIGYFHIPLSYMKLFILEGGETIMGKVSGNTHTQNQINNYSNQHNPNNQNYQGSKSGK